MFKKSSSYLYRYLIDLHLLNVTFFLGRIDNIVKRMGQRLSLDYVEQIAVGSGLVFNCCAFMSAKMLMLACVFQPGLDSLSSERLNNHFKNVAKSCEVPDRIIAFDCLPVSKHGKVDRKQLLQMVILYFQNISDYFIFLCLR